MAEYDPNKNYRWESNTKFEMNGEEFGLVLNTFRSILQKPEAQEILLINRAHNIIENVLKQSVEAGNIKEVQKKPENTEELKIVSD